MSDTTVMSTIKSLSRREFMALTGRAGGAFVIGSSLTGATLAMNAAATPSEQDTPSDNNLGVFVTIDSAGDVEIICHRMEMGKWW